MKSPRIQGHEEAGYWRDVGTIQALDEARRDLAGTRPRLELANPDWPPRPKS